MSFPIALVFHFNQHTHEYAAIASRACYRGLLNVLRAHPDLKFNLHLSGTLLRALNWFDPQTLDLVRAGLADGQFELLGSTYAQNIPYACDDWDNAQQIGLHRAVLRQLFAVEPTVFWNAERCWRQSLVPVVAAGGYTLTLVEDHIFRAAGLTDPVPVRTKSGAQALTCVYDDPVFRERFNYAAWFGRRAQLFNYLETFADRPGSDRFVLAYAEDAEAMGLWPWEAGYLPHATWAQLDRLLDEIEARGAFKPIHLSTVRPQADVAALPDGAARWMDRALLRADAPYHEDGYESWFDFLRRAPKVQYFNRLYEVVRTNLRQVGEGRRNADFSRPAATAADRFYRQALETYCSHQYEFGCIGVGGRGDWGWENVRATFLYARLAEIAEDPQPRRWIEDLNGDGSDEQLLCDGRQLAVLTAYGGRLLGWFDLAEGRQAAGNPLAVPWAPYGEGASQQPRLKPVPRRWLPDTFDADLRPWKDYKRKEMAPTRLGRHLAPELFARDSDELTVYVNPPPPDGEWRPRPAQTGALNDWLALDDAAELPPDSFLDYRFEPEGVVSYLNALLPEARLDKRVALTPDGIQVRYELQNLTDRPRRVRWRLASELAPDYAEMLLAGASALQPYAPGPDTAGVLNTATGRAVLLQASRPWAAQSHQVHLLGLNLQLHFEFDLAAQAAEAFDVTLRVVDPRPDS